MSIVQVYYGTSVLYYQCTTEQVYCSRGVLQRAGDLFIIDLFQNNKAGLSVMVLAYTVNRMTKL